MSAWELPFSRINRIRLRHQRYLARQMNQFTTPETTSAADKDDSLSDDTEMGFIDLLDLLVMARGLGATDPRDKVYVSMASPLSMTGFD